MLESDKVTYSERVPAIEREIVTIQPSSPKRSRGHSQEMGCKRRKKVRKWVRKKAAGHVRSLKPKVKKCLRTKSEAPFNSTQFIMDEHDTLNDSDLSTGRPRRHRDSSFSVESEDPEDEVSSTEEEEEFLTQQFWTAYEEFNAERLDAMSKSQLVQEYFALEERLTTLERELKDARQRDQRRIREPSPVEGEEVGEAIPGEVPVDAETAAKIEIFRTEIQNLEVENDRLRQENSALRSASCRCSSPSSSSSSSSSSSDEESDLEDTVKSRFPPSVGVSSSSQEVGGPSSRLKLTDDFRDIDSGIATSEGISSASSGDDLRNEEPLVDNRNSSFRNDRPLLLPDPT